MNRFDTKDLIAWRSEAPFWKLIGHTVGSIAITIPAALLGYLIDGLVFVTNVLLGLRFELWKWSAFMPAVIEPGEVPYELRTHFNTEHSRLCVECHEETDESLRIHQRCLREMFPEPHCEDPTCECQGKVTDEPDPGSLGV